MNKCIVQKGTENEFPIAYTLEGNLHSKNLLVMIHGGGMDLHEQGVYPFFDHEGKPVKHMIDGKMKTVLFKQHIGNYDRIAGELEALDIDALIVRIDLRNHGASVLENGEMDKRDTSVLRFSGDVADVIQSVVEEFEIENIHLHGTCMGGLVSQCVAVGLTTSKTKEYMNKIRSLFLNCPLAFEILGTMDPNDGFNYQKNKMILDGPNGTQFTKMKGLFEGKATLKESSLYFDLPEKVASLQLPTFYLYGKNDQLIPSEKSRFILERMKAINPNITSFEMDVVNSHGVAQHCLYSPQCADMYLRLATQFYEDKIQKGRVL